jgi:hypothetical protein
MLYRAYTEDRLIASSVSNSTTYSLRIPQSRRRLEAIFVEVKGTNAGTAPTWTKNGALGAIREVRVKVNDIFGQRNAVQARGPELCLWAYNQLGTVPLRNAAAYQNATISAVWRNVFPIYLRHPAIDEPIGNLLGIPLNQVNEDPTLEIDIGPTTDMASANPPTINQLRATLVYREVDPKVAYLPTELVSNQWAAATGKTTYDMPNGGFISSISLDPYSTYPTTKGGVITDASNETNELMVDLGSIAVRRYYGQLFDSIMDAVTNFSAYGAAAIANPYAFLTAGLLDGARAFNWCLDFLFDDTNGGALSPGSMLNANTIPLGGDKVRLTLSSVDTAGTIIVTHHKFLTRDPNDLKALIMA